MAGLVACLLQRSCLVCIGWNPLIQVSDAAFANMARQECPLYGQVSKPHEEKVSEACTKRLCITSRRIQGFPKIRGTFLGAPIIWTIVYWGLYWGPLFRETTILAYSFPVPSATFSGD